MPSSSGDSASNIVINHDFSGGLHSWHPNICCDGFVVSAEIGHPGLPKRGNCAAVSNRKECWHGLAQDKTSRVFPGSTYSVSADVGISGPVQGPPNVIATLKLEFQKLPTRFLFIRKTTVSNQEWGKFEGTFCLSTMPDRVLFYFEGLSPGADLLIECVVITCSIPSVCSVRTHEIYLGQ